MARHGQPESPRKGTEAGEAVGAVLGQVGGSESFWGEAQCQQPQRRYCPLCKGRVQSSQRAIRSPR